MFKNIILTLLLLSGISATAQTTYFATNSGNWSSSVTWSNGAVPPAGGSNNITIYLKPSVNSTYTNDLAGDFYLNVLREVGAFTVTNWGNALVFTNAGALMTNANNFAVIFNNPIYLGASITLGSAGSGGFNFNSNITETASGTCITNGAGATGTVYIYRTNTASGGMFMRSGLLSITNDFSLGAANAPLVFIGSSTLAMPTTTVLPFNANRSITISNGVTATFTSGNGAKNFLGPLQGPQGAILTFPSSTSLAFSNVNNTFQGTLNSSSSGNTTWGLDMVSISDGAGDGAINLGAAGVGGTFRWFGPNKLQLANRVFNLAGTTGGGAVVAMTTNIIITNGIGITGNGNKSLTLGGTTGGTNILGCVFTNGTSSIIGLIHGDTGTWSVTNNNNTFSGTINNLTGNLYLTGTNSTTNQVIVNGGNLYVSSIASNGVNCSLGAGQAGVSIVVGGNSSPIFRYIGGAASCDRQFTIGYSGNNSTGPIYNDGTGPLTLTATNFVGADPGGAFARPITVGGAYTAGTNVITGTIANYGTAGSSMGITKAADSSYWQLSGTNTYTGNTVINSGGALITTHPLVLSSNSAVSILTGGKLALNFVGTNIVDGLFLNGVIQPGGIYNSNNTPTYISGSGALYVAAWTPIAWSPAVSISGTNDVSTSGSYVYAYDAGSSVTNLNGVPFTNYGVATPWGNVTIGWATPTFASPGTFVAAAGLSGSYSNALSGASYNGASSAGTLTLNALTAGHQYQVQIWQQDPRSGATTNRAAYFWDNRTAGTGYTTNFYNVSMVPGGVGQYVVGTFSADSQQQNIFVTPFFRVVGGSASAQLNAISVRDLTAGTTRRSGFFNIVSKYKM